MPHRCDTTVGSVHHTWLPDTFDDEIDTELCRYADDEQAAEQEADEGAEVSGQVLPAATSELLTVTGQRQGQLIEASELLLPVAVEKLTELDGVWWDDLDDPVRLSAPRGVLVPPRLPAWDATLHDPTSPVRP